MDSKRFVIAASLILAACTGASSPRTTTPSPGRQPEAPAGIYNKLPALNAAWPMQSLQHVDLWLHTYAMIMDDTAFVPYFMRGYRDRMKTIRADRFASSLLDQNRDKLRAGLTVNPALATNGQFLPLYFPSLEIMRQAIEQYAAGGSTRSNDQTRQMQLDVIAAAFPSAADRAWLQQFAETAADEDKRFYHAYWLKEYSARYSLLAHVDSVWQLQWRPTLQRFLNNTQQQNGNLYMSMPLGGEGRTVQLGKGFNDIAVAMPGNFSEADQPFFVMVHEVTGRVASQAIADNTTPSDVRAGVGSRYEQAAAVRAGAMLLERVSPKSVPGYMRYYLQQVGRTAPTDPKAMFISTFALPDHVRDGISKLLESILGGI